MMTTTMTTMMTTMMTTTAMITAVVYSSCKLTSKEYRICPRNDSITV